MKKVLSFVLILALVLSSFSMAFAASTTNTGLPDIGNAANRQAIEVCYNLGIVQGTTDGTYQPEKTVTRAEFAAMMVRAQNIPDSALTGYTSSSFKDTSGYGWAVKYLAFCESKGILVGDGYGNVMPGRTVTANEAVTMALRTIGYTNNSAKLVGSWPSNYVTLAQTEGLYDSVAATSAVDRSNAAQVIYNLLTVGLVQVATDGTTVSLGKSATVNGTTEFIATTLLTANHNAVSNDRVVTYDEDSLINTLPYVGDYATVYTDKDDDYIIAIGKIKSVELTGKFQQALTTSSSGTTLQDSIDAGKLEFKADGVTYTFSDVDNAYKEFLNAEEGSLADSAWDIDDNFTINAKVTGKKLMPYSVEKWVATAHSKIEAADLTDIDDAELLGSDFATDKNDDIVLNSFEIIGAASLKDIKANNIVYVYEADGDGDIRRVAVGTEVVEGLIKSYNKDDEFVVDGKTYENSTIAEDPVELTNVGDTLKLYLDAYGDVYTFDTVKGTGSAGDYGVVTRTYTGSGYDKQIRMMNAEGTAKTYTVTDDTDQYALIEDSTPNPKAGQLIAYSIDKNGEIDDIIVTTSALSNAAPKSSITISSDAYMSNNRTLTTSSGSFVVSKDVNVFTHDSTPGASNNGYDVTTVDKIEKGSSEILTTYQDLTIFLNKDKEVVAMVVDADYASSSKNELYGVINDSLTTTNDDGDKAYQIVGFANGSKLDKFTTSRGTSQTPDNFDERVIVYKFGVDADGVINKLTEQTPGVGSAVAAGTVSGSAISIFGGGVEVTADGKAGVIQAGGIQPIADTARFYELTLKDNDTKFDKYKTGSIGNIKTGHTVWLFETDKDEDGYDVVVYYRGVRY